MKKILVATDFTNASRNAAEYAAALATEMAATMQLLHVYMEPMPVGNVPDYRAISPNVLQIENARQVNKEIARLKEKYGVPVNGELALGFKGDTIREKAEELNADLVVMGMKEDGKTRFPGSTVTRMIRKSSKPLLIVPEKARFRPVKNIVVAIDFRGIMTSSGLTVLFELIKKFNAAGTLLHVNKKGAGMGPSEVSAKLQIKRVFSKLTYHEEEVEYDDVDEGILDFVHSHPTDLLVMIAHKRSLFQRLFNPSHTRAVSFGIRIPLLVVKPPELFA